MSGLLLYVRTCCGRTLPIDLPPDATWGDLEGAALQAGCGGFLTYGGAEHSTEALLSDIGVGQESAVHEVTKRQCWTELGTGIVRYDIGRASTAPVRRVRVEPSSEHGFTVCLGRAIPPGGASAWRVRLLLLQFVPCPTGRVARVLRATGITASDDVASFDSSGRVACEDCIDKSGGITSTLSTTCHQGPAIERCHLRVGTELCFVLQDRTLYIGQTQEDKSRPEDVRWLCAHSGIDVPVRPYFSFRCGSCDVVRICGGEGLLVPLEWREHIESTL
eukprot:TRINITY_DN5482_c0_g1_i3.p1 TRINITY_DN5482_c0_g1~~TRINITY_DN5482_c0_g1_i3.p1  ORF type:complete len:276 (+),score=38.73 TRINITY_DN5482_c0_g1_i3:56-883(+)